MTAWMNFAAAWLLDFGLLASVLLVVLAIGRWLCRSPGQRMALAWGTWLGLLLLAVLTALPQWPRRELAALILSRRVHERSEMHLLLDELPSDSRVIAERKEMDLPSADLDSQVRHAALMHPTDAPQWHWPGMLLATWLVAAGLALAWIALGLAQTWRLVAHSAAAPAWVLNELERLVSKRRRKPRALTSTRLTSAAAIGAIRPKILLPQAGVEETNAPAVRAALAHEWAHIRHGDLWLLAVERLLVPLLAWHPLFWWLRRGVRMDQELLADAAAAGDEPVEYAEALLAWAKTARPAPAGLAALSLWESPHTLSRRVTMLLDSNRSATKCLSRGWQVAFVLLAAAFVCGLSLVTLRTLVADEEQPKTFVLITESAADSRKADNQVPPAPEWKTGILLQATVLEGDVPRFVQEKPQVTFANPVNGIDVQIAPSQAWEVVLAEGLTQNKLTTISRPSIVTLDGQAAIVQIATSVPPPPETPGLPEQLGLYIEVTPRLQLKAEGSAVRLSINLRQNEPAEAGGLPSITKRALSLSVEVPLGKTVVITRRPEERPGDPNAPAQKTLILAIEPQTFRMPGEAADKSAASDRSAPVTRELQQRLTELRGQIDRLAAAPTDKEVAGVWHTMLRLERDLDRLLGPGESNSQARVYPALLGDAAEVAKQINDRLKDRKIAGVTVNVDSRSNSLVVVSSTETPYAVIQDVITQIAQATKGEPQLSVSLQAGELKPGTVIDSRPRPSFYPVTGDATMLAEQVRERLKAENIPGTVVGADAKSNSLIVAAPGYDEQRIRKIIAAVEAEQAPPAAANQPPAARSARQDWTTKEKSKAEEQSANNLGRQAERETQIKLMNVDIEVAALARKVAIAELESIMEIQKRNPSAISDAELRKAKFQVERTELEIRRLQIMLEGLEKPAPQPGPISR